ncbi:hypothetical protein CFC21_094530 [Triticum aestivum]|uniref:Cytochrome c domain-containing protein n=2 Tax=Triticum aestivum TaxID=4565 RepID=A0A9R1LN95_WHEAT|nr:uncharacterized protein LOC123142146 [Triticum aestivum]KAF7091999.1 hypothetical protein CFC21_094530 [Triticum aestivum]
MAAPTAACSWAPQDAAQRGQKVFMQVCAGCHVMLPYAGLRAAAQGEVGAQMDEIVVAEEAATAARSPSGGSYTPDLTALTTKIHEGAALYTTGGKITTTMPRMLTGGVSICQELMKKMVPPSAMWMQLAQPYIGTIQMASSDHPYPEFGVMLCRSLPYFL